MAATPSVETVRTAARFCVLAVLLWTPSIGFAQQTYTYTHTGALPAGSVWAPSINSGGQVAFIVKPPSGSRVYRIDGTSLTTLYSYAPGERLPEGHASINASGVVAFGTRGFFSAIEAGDGTSPPTVVALANATWSDVRDPSINDLGDVVFTAFESATNRYHVAMGSAFTLIASPGDAVQGGTLYQALWPTINNNGAVAFAGPLGNGVVNIYRDSNGQRTLIGPWTSFGMNDGGLVAFYTGDALPGVVPPVPGIVTSDGVTQTPIASSMTGFRPVPHQVAINDAGNVAFLVTNGLGGANDFVGVFVGNGVDIWPVVRAGDMIPGLGTVLSATISNDAINDSGQVAIVVTYDDGLGQGDKQAIVRADPAVNAAPVAQDDATSTDEDAPVSGTLIASDANADPLTYSIVANGTLGTAIVTDPATGAFTYTPNSNANGTDTFTFMANDGTADSNVATVTVTIAPVNDPPVAQDSTASTFMSTPVAGTLVASDVDGPSLAFAIVTNGVLGTVVITNASTGAFTYTPAAGQSGVDTFTFQASDGTLSSFPATVTVTIVNRPPVATSGSLNVLEDRSGMGRLSATDPDGQPLVFTIVSNGSLGTATITNAAQGRYSYVPGPNANGTDAFTFRASDGIDVSNVATILVTIAPVNDAPVALNSAVTTSVNTPVTGAFAATDVDGDTLTFTIARAPRRGNVTIGASGSFTYTPGAGFTGTDSFTFRASDGTTSARATVTVTVQ